MAAKQRLLSARFVPQLAALLHCQLLNLCHHDPYLSVDPIFCMPVSPSASGCVPMPVVVPVLLPFQSPKPLKLLPHLSTLFNRLYYFLPPSAFISPLPNLFFLLTIS